MRFKNWVLFNSVTAAFALVPGSEVPPSVTEASAVFLKQRARPCRATVTDYVQKRTGEHC